MNINKMSLEIESDPRNESFARVVVASFMTRTNPTLEEVADVKTAVSEAVTNAIVHGYEEGEGRILIKAVIDASERTLEVQITDYGKGIEDIKKAMEPMYTSKPEKGRSGMGFSFMEAFMDELSVESEPGKGTTVKMKKKVGNSDRETDGE